VTETDVNWLSIEVRHLAALEAVANEGTFRKAAQRLGYVPSAVSQQLATLERAAGKELVTRSQGHGGGVKLTRAGELLLAHGREILAQMRAARMDLAAEPNVAARELRIRVIEPIASTVLPSLLTDFRCAWPHIEIVLDESSSDSSFFRALEHGDADIGFTELPAPQGPFSLQPLLVDPYLLLVRHDADLPPGPVGLDKLARVPLIGRSECCGVRDVGKQLGAYGVEPQIVVTLSRISSIQALVRSGVAAAILPASAVDRADPKISTRDIPDLAPRVVSIAQHRNRMNSLPERCLIELAQQVCDVGEWQEDDLEGSDVIEDNRVWQYVDHEPSLTDT
jgi:molybdate transport repressor ModE-like protein